VIRRYLALHVGHPCTELRRTESERILRAQPFISDATVVAYSDGPDGVIIEVTVVDEVSLILDGTVSGNPPHLRSVRVGEANLFGAGVYTVLGWREGLGFRDEYGSRFAHYQLFGRPYQFIAQGARRALGHDWSVEASHPYLTELQRIAWRTNYSMSDGYSRFLRPADTSAALALKRTSADIGGVVRFGLFERSGVDVTSGFELHPPVIYPNVRFTRTDPMWIGPLVVYETAFLANDPTAASGVLEARRAERRACELLLPGLQEPQGCRDAEALLELADPAAALRQAGFR
jgi:hypothetical protein